MSDCCSTSNKESHTSKCPQCDKNGKSVDIITLKSLLTPEAMRRLDSSINYQFCRSSECPIVYFNSSSSFTKNDLTVDVFQKTTGNNTPACYCFGFDKQAIIDDVRKSGRSTIQEDIKQYVKDKKCACEIRNPQGSCCLGNIGAVIKDMSA